MANLTLWKDEFVLHCPKCDNVWDLEWLDGSDILGECQILCPECLSRFTATGRMFKSQKREHGALRNRPYRMRNCRSPTVSGLFVGIGRRRRGREPRFIK